MNSTTVQLLLETLSFALNRATDAELKLAALENVLKSQNPALHAAYLAEFQRLEKGQNTAAVQSRFEDLNKRFLQE